MSRLHIVPGPTVEVARRPDSRSTRWCFGCRKHLPHEWVTYDYPPDVETYFDPVVVLKCTRCDTDLTRFPGT